MALFAILHLWAFPYRPYMDNAPRTFYPVANPAAGVMPKENEHYPRAGGFLGLAALWDAINIWDIIKAFGRGIRWLFVGVKHRHNDVSYQQTLAGKDMDDLAPRKGDGYNAGHPGARSTDHLPIATEFRRSRFDIMNQQQHQQTGLGRLSEGDEASSSAPSNVGLGRGRPQVGDEGAGLIEHAQPMSSHGAPSKMRQEQQRYGVPESPTSLGSHEYQRPYRDEASPNPYQNAPAGYAWEDSGHPSAGRRPRDSTQAAVGRALWGSPPPPQR